MRFGSAGGISGGCASTWRRDLSRSEPGSRRQGRPQCGERQEEAHPDQVEGQNSKGPTQVEGPEKARRLSVVEQDAGDEKPREDEEEFHAGPTEAQGLPDELRRRAVDVLQRCAEVMKQHDHGDGETPQPVEPGHTSVLIGVGLHGGVDDARAYPRRESSRW